MSRTANPQRLRSLYRRLIRELPAKPASSRSPIHERIRSQFQSKSNEISSQSIETYEQMAQFVRAQRLYTTLVERYNPGMNMDEEERVRLSARRVGINLPIEYQNLSGQSGGKGGEGQGGSGL